MSQYKLQTTRKFEKEFRKLDKYTQRMIAGWIDMNLASTTTPRRQGKALTGDLRGLWRYRIGTYRLICKIEDNKLVILALHVGHRRDIYK